jgi:hypothetical protein
MWYIWYSQLTISYIRVFRIIGVPPTVPLLERRYSISPLKIVHFSEKWCKVTAVNGEKLFFPGKVVVQRRYSSATPLILNSKRPFGG